VHVLLAGQPRDRRHHLVSDRAAGAGRRQVRDVVECHRLADAHLDAVRARHPAAWRQHLAGAGHCDRDDGGAGAEHQVADSRAPAVEAPVRRPRSLRVEAEELAVAQEFQGRVQGGLRGAGVVTVDRQLTRRAQVRGPGPPGRPARGEVLGLGGKGHRPGQQQRQVNRVNDGQVIRGEDGRPRRRDAPPVDEAGPAEGPQDRPGDEPGKLVRHECAFR
jgi:hypothetical protein